MLKEEVEYLGYIVKKGKVKPSPGKTVAVANFAVPKTIIKLQSYLGLTGYFRKFIKDYSLIAKPLSDLLKKDVPFKFNREQHDAFQQLKKALVEEPVLKILEYGATTELHTDACYGAIL